MKIHKGKTEFMTNVQTNESIVVEKDAIEKVDSYKYLGQTVKMEDNTREEVLIRIKVGWSCFGRYMQRYPIPANIKLLAQYWLIPVYFWQ